MKHKIKDWLYIHGYCEWKLFRWIHGGNWTKVSFCTKSTKDCYLMWIPEEDIKNSYFSSYQVLKREVYD